MALDQAKLRTELAKVMDQDDPLFVGYPDTPVEIATNFCNAYNAYTLDATDASGDSFLTLPNLALMISTLVSNLPAAVLGTPVLAAAAFEAAFVAYWSSSPVTFNILNLIGLPLCPNIGVPPANDVWGLELTSVVTAVTPGVLQNLLLTMFSVNSIDTQAKITEMRDAFHIATTQAVFATIIGTDTTPPPVGPYPISNLCTLF